MEIVADASVFLAVVLHEEDRDRVIHATAGKGVVAPEILPYEIGNALVAMQRRGRLRESEVLHAFDLSQRIPVTLVPVDIRESAKIAVRFHIYAYDAYYLRCCIEHRLSLVSLDHRMCDIAENLGITVVR